MALVACNSCGHQISSRARACPKCGAGQVGELQPERPEAAPLRSAAPVAPPLPAEPAASAEVEPEESTDSTGSDRSAKPAKSRKLFLWKRTPKGVDSAEDERHEPDPCLGPAPEPEPEPEPEPAKPVENWYYIASTGRGGPVEYPFLKQLVESGHFPPEIPVWKAGMADWVKFCDYAEPALEEEVFVPPGREVSNLYIWALAFAPLWGAVVQILATETKVALTRGSLAYYAEMWWLVVTINLLLSWLDYRSLTKSGEGARGIGKWLCLLVPFYIYRRDRALKAKLTRVCIWTASAAVTVALFLTLNGMYTQIAVR